MSARSAVTSLARRERTPSSDRHLGIILAFIAGAVNAGGFVAVNRYTSHMTGIVSSIADALILHQFHAAIIAALFVVCFMSGAVVSSLIINYARTRHYHSEFALALLVEAFLLILFSLCATQMAPLTAGKLNLTIDLLCFIMGLQNAIITKISHAEIRTTHVTGICTDIGIEIGRYLYRAAARSTEVVVHPVKLRFHCHLLSAFLIGGLTGAESFTYIGFVATIPLAFVLIAVAIAPVWADLHHVKTP